MLHHIVTAVQYYGMCGLLDPETKVQRYVSTFFLVLRYLRSVDVVLCIFGIMPFRYCTTVTVLHRGGCKQIVVHGFDALSAGLEAAPTS